MKRIIISGFIVTAIIILTNLPAPAQIPSIIEQERSYQIGPGDVITVKVMGEPDFGFVATVDDNGILRIPFPKTGISAKCRTENQLQDDVATAMSKYLRDPMVSLTVTERKSRPPVSVMGEVKQPQGVILTRKTRLMELLSFVGYVTEDSGGMVQVFHTRAPVCELPEETAARANDADTPYRLYSLNAMKKDGGDDSNPVIYPGDIVMVQKALPIYVTGEVRQPQGIRLNDNGTSLTQAIAMVGGMNREARTSNVKVYRLKEGQTDREIILADIKLIKAGKQKDIMLEPYDIVEVDKAKKNVGQIILDIAIGAGKSGISSFGSGGVTRILY